jgi:hypothetical protein
VDEDVTERLGQRHSARSRISFTGVLQQILYRGPHQGGSRNQALPEGNSVPRGAGNVASSIPFWQDCACGLRRISPYSGSIESYFVYLKHEQTQKTRASSL